jgi:hypothetical protein
MKISVLTLILFISSTRAETSESSENNPITIEPLGICDPHCIRECESNFSEDPSTCSSQCGCDEALPHEQEFINSTPSEKDDIRWSIHTNSIKPNLNCELKCERFCVSIDGDFEACTSKCSEKFCKNFLKSWIFFLVFLVILSFFLIGTWKLLKKSHKEDDYFPIKGFN